MDSRAESSKKETKTTQSKTKVHTHTHGCTLLYASSLSLSHMWTQSTTEHVICTTDDYMNAEM